MISQRRGIAGILDVSWLPQPAADGLLDLVAAARLAARLLLAAS